MLTQVGPYRTCLARARICLAFTLPEVMVSIVILALIIAGVCYGYAEANRIATWDSMSQAAQSFAVQGMETARSAKWNPWVISTNSGPDPGSQDELPAGTNTVSLVIPNILNIPAQGNPQTNYNYWATDYVYVTWYPGPGPSEPPVRQILSQCVWTFPLTGKQFTSTIVTLRGPDQ